jgi:hypothetical protein
MRLKKVLIRVVLSLSAMVMGFCATAQADGKRRDQESNSNLTSRLEDGRLPPVLPGERVVTESGDEIKVWSSAGPVPVASPPAAPVIQGQQQPGIGVIVDGRGLVPGVGR